MNEIQRLRSETHEKRSAPPPLVLALAALLLLLAGCGSAQAGDASGKLRIVTTTGQIADIVRNIGGERIEVTALMGPGIDPHLYVASEGDVNLLQEADAIFYNGLFLEAQLDDVLKQIGSRKPSIAVGEQISGERLLAWGHKTGDFDPHIWFDVALWMGATEAVRDALVTIDAPHAAEYEQRAADYLRQLQELDEYVRAQAERLPSDKRVLVTAHDAFHYFGRAYGFDVRGLQGISTASEAGTADVRELADFIATQQIPAIFIETSVPVRNVEALQAAVKDRGFSVKIGGQLYSDALGSPDSDGGTYIGMVKHNIDTIVNALMGGS